MRYLPDVIDKIVEVAPDLEPALRGRRSSCLYTAPEMMYLRWNEVAEILNDVAATHPQKQEIASIFSGKQS